jgi:hypothetical protein
MKVVLNLTEGQIADICAQLLPKAKPAAKRQSGNSNTEHRRTYQRDLMRKRRAAAKASASVQVCADAAA